MNSLNENLNLLRTKLQKLEYDLKTARLSIDKHCSYIKAQIDYQTELMIKEINEKRNDLLSQIDEYQNELFKDLEQRINRSRVEKMLAESLEILNNETNIELVKQQLKAFQAEEQNLRKKVFKNKLIDFESIIVPNVKLVGSRLVL